MSQGGSVPDQHPGASGISSALGQSIPDTTPLSKKKRKKFKLTEAIVAMEKKLEQLIHRRGVEKGKLTRMLNSIQHNEEEVVQLTEAETKFYLRKLEDAHEAYQKAHDEIIATVSGDDRDRHDKAYEEYDLLHDTVSILLEEQVMRINAAKAAANAAAARTNAVPNQAQGQAQVVIQQPLRTPIPTFDGRYENWPKFKAMFKDLVDKGPDPPAVKLYHLDKSLVGSAMGLIDAKTINEGNYAHAWKILEERYENKRHAIDSHIHGLLNLKRMTKRSHAELRSLVDECSKHVEGLKFLERPFEGVGEDFVIHLLASSLHNDVRHLWESTIKHGELPKYDEMLKFLKEQTFILERVEASNAKSVPIKQSPAVNKPSVQKSHATLSSEANESKCDFCGKSHLNFTCSEFKSLSVPQRLDKVRERNVCFNCLKRGHRGADCPSERTCQKCKRRHHSLLHAEEKARQTVEPLSKSTPPAAEQEEQPTSSVQQTVTCSSLATRTQQVLLLTAVVDIMDKNYQPHPCRVLLDSGSQVNLLSRSMADSLGLKQDPSNVLVAGVNGIKTLASNSSVVHLSSKYASFQAKVKCLITDKVTANIPTSDIDIRSWELPTGVSLADPEFFESRKVDMLLGNEWFLKLLLPEEIVLADSFSILRETQFGWVVGGVYDEGAGADSIVYSHTVTMDELSQSIQRFWDIEDISAAFQSSTEEDECEHHFQATHRRDESGRYTLSSCL